MFLGVVANAALICVTPSPFVYPFPYFARGFCLRSPLPLICGLCGVVHLVLRRACHVSGCALRCTCCFISAYIALVCAARPERQFANTHYNSVRRCLNKLRLSYYQQARYHCYEENVSEIALQCDEARVDRRLSLFLFCRQRQLAQQTASSVDADVFVRFALMRADALSFRTTIAISGLVTTALSQKREPIRF